MQFAVIDLGGGRLDFMFLKRREGDVLHGLDAFTGQRTSTPVDKVIHLGMSGGAPNAVLQFTPNWISAQLSRAGAHSLAIAANPRDMSEEHKGWRYQTGQIKWTADARKDRRVEIERMKIAYKDQSYEPIWATLDVNRLYGYEKVRAEIEAHQEERNPDALWWCFVFAILTAAEDTDTAEDNVGAFWEIMAPRLVRFGPSPGLLSFAEFKPLIKGFQAQRFRYINELARKWPQIAAICQNKGLRGRAMRERLLFESKPVGLAITKGTFALEIFGQDVACLDRWIMRAISETPHTSSKNADPMQAIRTANRMIEAHCKWSMKHGKPLDPINCEPLRTKKGPFQPFDEEMYALSGYYVNNRFASVTRAALADYEYFEDRLKLGPYYRYAVELGAPNPLARAQWTMWEDILRHASDRAEATHGEIFEAIKGTRALREKLATLPQGSFFVKKEEAKILRSIASETEKLEKKHLEDIAKEREVKRLQRLNRRSSKKAGPIWENPW